MKYFNGEYKSVQERSINYARLRAAHQTPCDAATAYFLIAYCHRLSFGENAEMPTVKLRKPRAGKHRARGWGGRKARLNDEGKVYYKGYVSLPETKCPVEHIENPFGYLRVGLVLHEYAHALEWMKFGNSDHGPRFTMILDKLLYDTEQYWAPQISKAAEVK